jgi:hypothetical protein
MSHNWSIIGELLPKWPVAAVPALVLDLRISRILPFITVHFCKIKFFRTFHLAFIIPPLKSTIWHPSSGASKFKTPCLLLEKAWLVFFNFGPTFEKNRNVMTLLKRVKHILL